MTTRDPFEWFAAWLKDAERSESDNPTAAAIATVGLEGRPSVRMILLRGFDTRGFVFYTNLDSRKGQDIRQQSHTALCFHWKSLARQVRVEGSTEQVDDAEADAYFATRPRDSQIGAWASKQSEVLAERSILDARVAAFTQQFDTAPVPRPPFWSGYRVVPAAIEFWEEGSFRLHERTSYVRTGMGWSITKRYP